MTYDELLNYPINTPVRCADGAMALLIRGSRVHDEAGVQVPGEENIRWIPLSRLTDRAAGAGALEELAGD